MTINYQFGDVDAHGAIIRAQAAALEAEYRGAGSAAAQVAITPLGRNVQVTSEHAGAPGQKVQRAGSSMTGT
jgi:hypothetical protein